MKFYSRRTHTISISVFFLLLLLVLTRCNTMTDDKSTKKPPLTENETKVQKELFKEIADALTEPENLFDPTKALDRKYIASYIPTAEDMKNLKNLHISWTLMDSDDNIQEIKDISILSYAVNLESLFLSRFRNTDFSVLKNLTKLHKLTLSSCDLTTLENLPLNPSLIYMNVSSNQLESLKGIEKLTSLQEIKARENKLKDINALQHLTSLQQVDLATNSIEDISPLEKLTRLTKLDLSYNEIINISRLGAKPQLEALYLTGEYPEICGGTPTRKGNVLSDISILKQMRNLKILFLQDTKEITDISPLSALTKLEQLTVRGNKISDVTPLQNLTHLTYLHIYLNNIHDMNVLNKLANLTEFNFSRNHIKDIHIVKNMQKLQILFGFDNQVEDVSPIADLQHLKICNISKNQIADLSPLKTLIENNTAAGYIFDTQAPLFTLQVLSSSINKENTVFSIKNPIKGKDGKSMNIDICNPLHPDDYASAYMNDLINQYNEIVEKYKKMQITLKMNGDNLTITLPTKTYKTITSLQIPFLDTKKYEEEVIEIGDNFIEAGYQFGGIANILLKKH